MPLLSEVPEHEHYLVHFRDEEDRAGVAIYRCTRAFKHGGCVLSTKNLEIVAAINGPQEQEM
jgi:hypothetical protein